MKQEVDGVLQVTLHQFKNNISTYMRALEGGRYHAIMLYRGREAEPVGCVFAHTRINAEHSAENTGPTGPDQPELPTERDF